MLRFAYLKQKASSSFLQGITGASGPAGVLGPIVSILFIKFISHIDCILTLKPSTWMDNREAHSLCKDFIRLLKVLQGGWELKGDQIGRKVVIKYMCVNVFVLMHDCTWTYLVVKQGTWHNVVKSHLRHYSL